MRDLPISPVSVFDAIPVEVCLISRDLGIVFMNGDILALTGFSRG
jgi:hypothetical protein